MAGLDGGAEPTAADLRVAYAHETARTLRHRLDLSAVLFLAFVGTAVLLETTLHPERARVVAAFYLAEVLACGLAACAYRLRPDPASTVTIGAVLAGSLAILMNAYTAVVGSGAETLAMGLVCLMSGLAVLLPWGWAPQLGICLTSLLGFLAASPFVHAASDVSYMKLAIATGAVSTVCGAFFLDRYRYEAFARAALLAHVSAVRQEEAEISSALVHVGQTLSTHVGDANVFEHVNRLAVQALGCDWSSTFIFDDHRAVFRLRANVGSERGVVEELQQIEFPRDSLLLLQALRPGEVIEIADAAQQALIPVEMLRRLGVASALYVPLSRGPDIIGVIVNGYSERTGPFSRKQGRLALGIAHATAIALENQRLIADLQAANRLKSEFVSTMSHELRTPLNVILGYTELLCDEGPESFSRQGREILGRIQRSGVELLELVNATLDLARLEAGRDMVTLEPVNVSELFDEVARELDSLVKPVVRVDWRAEVAGGAVLTDRAKLKTIVKNLVGNALKYTASGEVAVSASGHRDLFDLGVRDTGIGIAPEHLSTIFEMFRQVDASATRKVGGVGLGLYIVKQLVERLGGSISVESQPGVGSRFNVSIPVRSETELRATLS